MTFTCRIRDTQVSLMGELSIMGESWAFPSSGAHTAFQGDPNPPQKVQDLLADPSLLGHWVYGNFFES